MTKKISKYKKSKECINLNAHNLECSKCIFFNSAYTYCTAYKTGYDKAKMEFLKENLERVSNEENPK